MRRTLKSVFNQTYTDVEVIVVDDGSNEPFDFSNFNLYYIELPINKGPGNARNIGMAKANGDYIVFLDSDDYWHPDYLKKVVDKLNGNTNAIMAYADGVYVDEKEVFVKEMRAEGEKSTNILPTVLKSGRPWGTGACLWRRNLIKNLKWSDTRSWEDYVFDVSAASICNSVEFVNEHLVYYDASGEDKLSNNAIVSSLNEKSAAILHIARVIENSDFFEDTEIKNLVLKLAINNTIALLKNDVKDNSLYQNNLEVIKMYKSPFNAHIISLVTKLNRKFGLKVLRKYRKKLIVN